MGWGKRCAAAVLAALTAWGPAQASGLERAWADAAHPFDAVAAPPAVAAVAADPAQDAAAAAEALKKAAAGQDAPFKKQDVIGPGDAPVGRGDKPTGIGPVTWGKRNYLTGLLGTLLGLAVAPLALALETVLGVALTPVRMVKGVAKGDWLSLLDPIRTAKNVVQDFVMTGAGMLNLAAGPVWNAFRPDQATDFQFANDRLIFIGGPIAGIQRAFGVGAMAPSWHTVWAATDSAYEHEFVHNYQWQRSFLWEKIGEDYRNYPDWRTSDAHLPLNW